MTTPSHLTARKALLFVIVVFLITACIRIPSLSRPLSRHHESIPALELVTIESWKQAGGPGAFHYIPVFNYQRDGDKKKAGYINADPKGNEIYISYGTGWNLLPYYLFDLLHIPATPIALRVLNMLTGLIACLLLFRLMALVTEDKSKKYYAGVIACTVFMFTPGTLWYSGNVYVNCGVAIPFIIAFLYHLMRMIILPATIRPVNLTILFLLIACLMFVDWIAAFLAFTSLMVTLARMKRNTQLVYPLVAVALATAGSMALIAYQFVSYLGWDSVRNYFADKFGFRTIHPSNGVVQPLMSVTNHFITASLPLVGLLLFTLIWARVSKKEIYFGSNFRLLTALLVPALLLYNITFLSWTSVHEFSILYYTIFFAVAAGIALPQLFPPPQLRMAIVATAALTVIEYYLINPPGKTTLNGEQYDAYQQLGEVAARKAGPAQAVFMNLELLPPVKYYAGRNISYANSLEEAKKQLNDYRVNEGVWIEQKNFRVTDIQYFHK